MPRNLIAIAGGIATGKSTLAEGLARHLGWMRLAATPLALDYLESLFADMSRWALEAQMAFAVDKVRELRSTEQANVNAIVERTLIEDIGIYGSFFRDRGYMNPRAAQLYDAATAELSLKVSPPDLVIVCHASQATIQVRMANRDRAKDRLYPDGHVEEITRRYQGMNAASLGRLVYSIDGEQHDWRHDDVLTRITSEVRAILARLSSPHPQMTIPWVAAPAGGILRAISSPTSTMWAQGRTDLEQESLREAKPLVYIAAPYTSEEASAEDCNPAERLFEHRSRPRIGRNAYRAALLAVAAAIRQYGLEPVLPHRDVSRWGDAQLTERDIAVLCTKAVLDCDLFIGLLGKSPGAHYECGLAIAMGKPAILIASRDLSDSTIAQGMAGVAALRALHSGPLLSFSVDRLEDVPDLLSRPEISQFIAGLQHET